jgi:hypothetical protein
MGKLLPLRHGEACGPSAGRAVLLDAGTIGRLGVIPPRAYGPNLAM